MTIVLKKLTKINDYHKIKALFRDCTDYSLMIDGYLPEEKDFNDLFTHVPENTPLENLNLLGAFNQHEELIGLLSWVKDYPEKNNAYIGLFLIGKQNRNRGFGKNIFMDFENNLISNGFSRILLAVLKENSKGLKFWESCNFRVIRHIPEAKFGNKTHERYELKKDLKVISPLMKPCYSRAIGLSV